MAHPKQSSERPHDEAEELLPWYATGQLEPADRARVEGHLLACEDCRQQLTVERRLIEEFQGFTPEAESGWARLRGRIGARVQNTRPHRQTFAEEVWALLTRPAVAVLAVAQIAFVVIAGSALLPLTRPAYHVLASAPVTADANVIVIFHDDTTEREMRQALGAAGASIVGGPTPADAYLLHVAPGQRHAAIAKLQSDDDVQLAQPIDGVMP
jgi:anti-sigma-K factor RskA